MIKIKCQHSHRWPFCFLAAEMVRAACLLDFDGFINIYTILEEKLHVQRLRGATVARLTPDQKVACSNHVGVINIFFLLLRPTGTSKNVFIYQNRADFGQNSGKVTSRSDFSQQQTQY